jgi:hypothetical protein
MIRQPTMYSCIGLHYALSSASRPYCTYAEYYRMPYVLLHKNDKEAPILYVPVTSEICKATYLTCMATCPHGIISSLRRGCAPERIEWIIKDQAFSASYDFAPPPLPHPPLPSVSSTGNTLEDWETETAWWQERGWGGGGGAKSYDGKKAWSSINHSILSFVPPPHTLPPCLNFHIYWYDLHEYSSSDLN